MRTHLVLTVTALALAAPGQAQTVYSASGQNASSIQGQVDLFRAALGTLNPNAAGSFGGGRREINWDGVPDNFSAPNALPANFFNSNSPRGAVFSTPGSGVQVSANVVNPTSTPVEFGNINPTYPGLFATFSAQKLFTATGSNIVDVSFFVPGSANAALVRGFGSVFSDVDLANTTSIQFFGAANNLLGTYYATPFQGNESLSFLGVDYGSALIARVRVTSGNAALAPGVNETGGTDLVAMDDFIFGEPIAVTASVPEPAGWALMIAGFALVGGQMRWRGRGGAAKRPAHVLPC